MFTLLIVFLMKFTDCALSTAKTVFLVKNKYFISSIMNSMAAALFIFVADLMANSESDMKIWIAAVVFLANLLGGYLPPRLIDKVEEDRLFIFQITSDTFESGAKMADKLRELNMPVSTNTGYNKSMDKILICNAYASTKKESKIISSVIKEYNCKWHVIQAI